MLLFQSLRSGSSGNLLLLESRRGARVTRLLIDCGLPSQRACLRILEEEVGLREPLAGLLVTHAHSDHVNYSTLRVMARLGVPVHAHAATLKEIHRRYLDPERLPRAVDPDSFDLRPFPAATFSLGPFRVQALRVPHAPRVTTHAFRIDHGNRRLLIASDFHDPEAIAPHIGDCDLVYLEANHDRELLRRHYNPASLYHLPNRTAGLLLRHACLAGRRPPTAVVLAHLSEERNRPALARETVVQAFGATGLPAEVTLVTAPRHAAIPPILLEP